MTEEVTFETKLVAQGAMQFPNQFRWHNAPGGYTSTDADRFGVFLIPGRHANGRGLKVIAADGEESGWDHVSATLPDSPAKCPSWEEMCILRKLFWTPDACVVQFHPPETAYVNTHTGCLHLWRCVAGMPMPPEICV